MESKVHTMAVVAAMAAMGGEYSHSLPRRDRSKTILTKKQKKARAKNKAAKKQR